MEPDYDDIISIIKFLHDKTVEDGGDGEAIWLTKHYKLKDIYDILKNYEMDSYWDLNMEKNCIIWGRSQECVYITDNLETFKAFTRPELKLQLH